MINVDWATFKAFVQQRNVTIQHVTLPTRYRLWAFDGPMHLSCQLIIADPASEDQQDFESNFRDNGNKSPNTIVTTQYELNDKTLKLARAAGNVDETGSVILYFKVPGTFGSGQGRYVVGGYGITEDYNKDDYVIIRIEDKDRIIALMMAQVADPNATEPLSDEAIQQMGVIPGLNEAFPQYPMVRSYTDEEAPEENKGWYFWPLAQAHGGPPIGEVEVNPIGGYGFIPSGFYIKLIYQRPQGITTGSFRANVDWGRKD